MARLLPYEAPARLHTPPSERERRHDEAAMKKKLRLLAATEEPQSSVNGQAATIHAPQGVTVVLTVPVHGARLARTVAIQWHRTREGLQKNGTPPADGAEGVTTITYNFAADRPGTFTYHARYRRDRDRAAGLVDVRASEAGPSGAALARTHEVPSAVRRACTTAGNDAVEMPRRDDGSAGGGSSARTAVPLRHGDGLALARCWGMVRVSVEAQLMGDCPVIYYEDAEYGGGAPVLGLLRRSAAALAAAALWVSGICGPRDPDMHPRRRSS